MKLTIDSNLSLSLTSQTATGPQTLFILNIELLTNDSFSEHIALFRNLDPLSQADLKSQLSLELSLIKSKANQSNFPLNSLQTINSGLPNYKWFALRDPHQRLFTLLTSTGACEKSILRFCEKLKSAVVHFQLSPHKLQQKVDSMALMFNESMNGEATNGGTKAKLAEISELSTAKDFSQTVPDMGMSRILETVQTGEKKTEEAAERDDEGKKRGWKNIVGVMVGLLVLWIFVHKFMRMAHRRH